MHKKGCIIKSPCYNTQQEFTLYARKLHKTDKNIQIR